MASSFLLSISVLVLFFSISSAYTRKWSSPNNLDQNPIRMIEGTIGVSEGLLELDRTKSGNLQQSGKIQTITVGTWGAKVNSSNGIPFDDGAYTGIRKIALEYNTTTAIGGLQVIYDVNGREFPAKKHKSTLEEFTLEKISFDFPREFIVEVSGYTGKVNGFIVVRSLTFKTNKKIYGPYGVTHGIPFNLPIERGLIVGMKGSVGYWLDYLGFHLSL